MDSVGEGEGEGGKIWENGIDNGRGYACAPVGGIWESLYVSFNFVLNLKMF